MPTPNIITLLALGICLIYVTVEDLRAFRIPNGIVLVLLALSIVHILISAGPGEIAARAVLAAVMFAVFVAAYGAGLMGGGDTKLLGAAILWIGPQWAVSFAVLLLAGSILVAGLVWLRAVPFRESGRRQMIPFGPAIASAWMLHNHPVGPAGSRCDSA